MLYLIAQILAVTISSWLLARKYFRIGSFSDSILVCFILSFAQIVLVELSLGIIGRLYFGNVFIAHLLFLLAVALVYIRKDAPALKKPDLQQFAGSNLILFAAAVFFAFFIIKTYYNLVTPPQDADGLLYHLAFPASWIKSGTLNNPIFIFLSKPVISPGSLATSSPSYYPINGELLFTWLMLPLRSAFLADLAEAPFYFIGIITVYSILRKYNVNNRIALLSGFLWALIPNIFKQLKTASNIDIISAALLLLIFFTLLLMKFSFTYKNSVLFGIVTGLFVGTKFNNFVWLMALTPLIVFVFYSQSRANKFTLSRILKLAGIIVLMVILFGGYMYIKNFLFLSNPFYPVELKIFGNTIFKGLLDGHAYKELFSSDSFNLFRLFREGLGLQFFTLILPGIFFPFIFYRYLKARLVPFFEYFLLFSTPLIMLILFKALIGVYIARYFFPFLSFGLLTAVIFIISFPFGNKYLGIIGFLSIFYAIFELAHRYELIFSLLLSVVLFMVLVINKNKLIKFYNNKMFGNAMLAFLLLAFLFIFYLNNKYNNEEFNRYAQSFSKKESWQIDLGKGWQALNEFTKDGAKVAYTGRQECYPLFGRDLKNEVKYISINQKEITPYNRPDGRYREIQDFSAWRDNLKQYQAGYLFIAKPVFANRESVDPDKFPIEDDWAIAHPEDFQLVFNNSLVHIYKVLIK